MKSFKDFILEAIQQPERKGSINIGGELISTLNVGNIYKTIRNNTPIKTSHSEYYHICGTNDLEILLKAQNTKMLQISAFVTPPPELYVIGGIVKKAGILLEFDKAELMMVEEQDMYTFAYGNKKIAKERFFALKTLLKTLMPSGEAEKYDVQKGTGFFPMLLASEKYNPEYKEVLDLAFAYHSKQHESFLPFIKESMMKIRDIMESLMSDMQKKQQDQSKNQNDADDMENFINHFKPYVATLGEMANQLTSVEPLKRDYERPGGVEVFVDKGKASLAQIIIRFFENTAQIKTILKKENFVKLFGSYDAQYTEISRMEYDAHKLYYDNLQSLINSNMGGIPLMDKVSEGANRVIDKIVRNRDDESEALKMHEAVIRNFHVKQINLFVQYISQDVRFTPKSIEKMKSILALSKIHNVPLRYIFYGYPIGDKSKYLVKKNEYSNEQIIDHLEKTHPALIATWGRDPKNFVEPYKR